MGRVDVIPDVITYAATISACEKSEQRQHTRSLLTEMGGVPVTPDRLTYSAALSACEKSEQWQQACCPLAEMGSVEVIPDVITYTATISACEKSEQWQARCPLAGMSCPIPLFVQFPCDCHTLPYHSLLRQCRCQCHCRGFPRN